MVSSTRVVVEILERINLGVEARAVALGGVELARNEDRREDRILGVNEADLLARRGIAPTRGRRMSKNEHQEDDEEQQSEKA